MNWKKEREDKNKIENKSEKGMSEKDESEGKRKRVNKKRE